MRMSPPAVRLTLGGFMAAGLLLAPTASAGPVDALLTVVNPTVSPDSRFAPVNRPGPALSVARSKLDAALACTATVARGRQTVIFVPGTTLTPRENFSWNWFKALDAQQRPYCAVTLPGSANGDTQIAAEYVVSAIRSIHARTGKKVQIVGYSQGGTEPRFALRFWPDLRNKVEDYVGLAATNHGSPVIASLCTPRCTPALWQQLPESQYLQALNSYQETFAGISYSQIYTRTDQFVQPNLDDTGTTSLSGPGRISNVALQDVCPTSTADHLAIGSYDPVAYALVMDALTQDGPVDPTRIDTGVCTQAFMPGVDPVNFPANYADLQSKVVSGLTVEPQVDAEPALRRYTLK